jgi:hypothetical protein
MKKVRFLIILLLPFILKGQVQLLQKENINLRNGSKQEWSSFPVFAKDSILVIHFNSQFQFNVQTLSITQTDVNQTWTVKLNDNMLGNLTPDEKCMITYFDIPQGILKEKNNELIIRSGSGQSEMPDDIIIENVMLINTSKSKLLNESLVNIHTGIPSRLTILNDDGALQPLSTVPDDTLAVRTGVIYSGTGNFSFSIPAGDYKIYASRGFEYGADSCLIKINKNEIISKKLTIKHEVILPGWKSWDTHLHTLEFSGHGDASMKERILTIAGEGLNYAVITEHNKIINITDTVKKMKMEKWFTAITGDELTTKVGHFNIFPFTTEDVPSAEVNNWKEVRKNIDPFLQNKVIILNHSRDIHNGFRPSDSLLHINKDEFPANAMEVMNSGSQQTDPRQLYHDWMNLMTRGIVLTPIGSSDNHDVSRFISGQSRTYVRSDRDQINNFIKGYVGVSFGLFTQLEVKKELSGNKTASIKVYAPSWIRADKVYLYANSKVIFTSKVSGKHKGGLIAKYDIPISGLADGTLLVAVAEGADPKVPWWPIAKPYQHTSPAVNPIVLGLTGVVRL